MFYLLQLTHNDTPAAKLANRVEILANIALNTLTPDVPNTLIGNMARACKHGRDFFYKNPVLEPVHVLPPLRYLGIGCHISRMEREIMTDRYNNLWEDIRHAFVKAGGERGRRWGVNFIRYEYVFRNVLINQCEKFWDNPKDINRIGLIVPRIFSTLYKTELKIYGTCLVSIGNMKTSKQDPNIYRNIYESEPAKVIAFCPCYDTREYVAVWDDVEKPPRRIPRNELPEFVMSHARKVMECRGAFVKKLESADAGTEPVV
jgi:hypothetical protein